jgi:hypothetical protein
VTTGTPWRPRQCKVDDCHGIGTVLQRSINLFTTTFFPSRKDNVLILYYKIIKINLKTHPMFKIENLENKVLKKMLNPSNHI